MARRRDDSATEPVIRVLATERAMEILIVSQTLRQRFWYSARLYGVHSGSVSSPSAMPYLTNVRMKSSVSGSTKPPVSYEKGTRRPTTVFSTYYLPIK